MIFSVSNGIECSWQVSYSDNFKIESNLTKDFNSLRQLKDYAITKNMLNTSSAASMAKKALDMLNKTLLSDF